MTIDLAKRVVPARLGARQHAVEAFKAVEVVPKSGGDSLLSPLGLPKANADSAGILVNEFHACSF
jgi:hypothetical protein